MGRAAPPGVEEGCVQLPCRDEQCCAYQDVEYFVLKIRHVLDTASTPFVCIGCPAPETRIAKSAVRSSVDARNQSNTTKSSPKQALGPIGMTTDRRNSVILGVVFLTLLGAG